MTSSSRCCVWLSPSLSFSSMRFIFEMVSNPARFLPCVLAAFAAVAAFADGGYKARPQPLARSLTPAQIDKSLEGVPRDRSVAVPAWYARQGAAFRDIGTNELARAATPALTAVIADSRKNIPELEGMSDVEVATLYLAQMTKPVEELQRLAPTNGGLEFLIGAGMRADIAAAAAAEAAAK